MFLTRAFFTVNSLSKARFHGGVQYKTNLICHRWPSVTKVAQFKLLHIEIFLYKQNYGRSTLWYVYISNSNRVSLCSLDATHEERVAHQHDLNTHKMKLQREEEHVSAAIARHNLRAFEQLLAQPPITHAELSAVLLASLPTGLQVEPIFCYIFSL